MFFYEDADFVDVGAFHGDEGRNGRQIFVDFFHFQNFNIQNFFISEGALLIFFCVFVEVMAEEAGGGLGGGEAAAAAKGQ